MTWKLRNSDQAQADDNNTNINTNSSGARTTGNTTRRSGRFYSTDTPVHDETDEGMGGKPTQPDSSDSDPQEVEREKNEAEACVVTAIKDLARMERRLMRAVKRQKLEVQKSNVPVRKDGLAEHAFKPRPTRNADRRLMDNRPVDWDKDSAAEPWFSGTEEPPGGSVETEQRGAARAPPLNSDQLPLPWRGRLGYACLNTYLRSAKPPIFSSRTCRMSSIIDHRHPLQDPTKVEHSMKNRPDRTQKADVALGQKYLQGIGLANARDIVKMVRWNEKYGIKFMRLSSEMFPFASHGEHGYKLAPFASEVLADAGRVIAELGHRVTMHPGQFTQLGSPRSEVIAASVRELAYHDELLTLLKLPPQQDRDAVLIIHMGGVYGNKAATIERFTKNYQTMLTPSIRARLVLENDDVSWSVHDLLPVCEALDIPLVLDWHHHNIVFDASQMREGTLDISAPEIQSRIRATWDRKGITQKMHYSESVASAVTPRERRKHSNRVYTLPPCRNDMDLMIEAKDKEQAVLQLMRNFRLPGYEKAADVIPFERTDDEDPPKKGKRKREIDPDEVGMGGPQNRVYWPPGMEEWLQPQKKEPMGVEIDSKHFDSSDLLE